MDNELYIYTFDPILKDKIWGGSKLKSFLKKEGASDVAGESWEISDVEGSCSVVNNGSQKGKTLRDLVTKHQEAMLGAKNWKRFGAKFPLLIKFIDAKDDLSVQLHPDDTIAQKKHNSLGKTEMWHIVQADEESNIIIGFDKPVSPEEYQTHVADKSIKQVLHYEPVTAGDTFFVYPGLIHAIGKGVLLAEIQQTSDITYRIYDWDRQDKDGNYRELHQEEALDAIDFRDTKDHKIAYQEKENELVDLVSCPHFITKTIIANKEVAISHQELDSFVVYMCVEGKGTVVSDQNQVEIQKGQSILVPAQIKDVTIKSEGVKLLQTYI